MPEENIGDNLNLLMDILLEIGVAQSSINKRVLDLTKASPVEGGYVIPSEAKNFAPTLDLLYSASGEMETLIEKEIERFKGV